MLFTLNCWVSTFTNKESFFRIQVPHILGKGSSVASAVTVVMTYGLGHSSHPQRDPAAFGKSGQWAFWKASPSFVLMRRQTAPFCELRNGPNRKLYGGIEEAYNDYLPYSPVLKFVSATLPQKLLVYSLWTFRTFCESTPKVQEKVLTFSVCFSEGFSPKTSVLFQKFL